MKQKSYQTGEKIFKKLGLSRSKMLQAEKKREQDEHVKSTKIVPLTDNYSYTSKSKQNKIMTIPRTLYEPTEEMLRPRKKPNFMTNDQVPSSFIKETLKLAHVMRPMHLENHIVALDKHKIFQI